NIHYLLLSTLLCVIFYSYPPNPTYTLALHDALPIWGDLAKAAPVACRAAAVAAHPLRCRAAGRAGPAARGRSAGRGATPGRPGRSEEHTSELQSRENLVCRLLLEKKNYKYFSNLT